MYNEYPTRYMPSSPLSPRLSADAGRRSPTLTRQSPVKTQATRRFNMELPTYSFTATGDRSASASPTSRIQSPAILLHRGPQPTPMDLQRSMGKGQRDLIRQLKLSSQLAASPATHRPDAPRLDPLGSPKGPMTPLALEQRETGDYFGLGAAAKFSPVASPGSRSTRSDGSDKEKQKKKLDLYP